MNLQKNHKFRQLLPTLKRLLAYGLAYRKPLTIAAVLLWLAAGAEVCGPVLISYFIDDMVAKNTMPLDKVTGITALFLLLQILAATLRYYQSLLFNRASIGVVQTIRCDVMDAALKQPIAVFDTQPVGQLISKVTNDTEVIKDLYVTVVATVLRSAALISVMLIAMFTLNWKMALVAMMIFPVVMILMGLYQRYSTPVIRQVRSLLADINNGFNEAISGMAVLQQFRQQARFGEQLGNTNLVHYQMRLKTLRLESLLLRPLLSLLSALVLSGLLLLFGFSQEGAVGVGVLYAFINYLSRLNEPLIELASQQAMLQQAIVAGERIFDLMDGEQQQYGGDTQPLASGSIDIRHLNFAYNQSKVVLEDINLSVASRDFVALVGHTGSGKSTLANLLMGYYPLIHGEIELDGRALKTLSHPVLRSGVAMVQQDPVVLADTVYANVALGRDINEAQVWQALHISQLEPLIKAMPQGLYTVLGEQGNNLSVGQKQLLALARVLVQTPQILILDEATANIDSGTEQAIHHALSAIRHKTTLVVIAHRLSTIVDADKIVVLNRGKMVECGNHQQLMAQKGRYYQMHQLQLAATALKEPV
ncbi:MAG: SmdB family multidrug efflux ABC transporter permease/ATP-binding protein [Enterobacteriaceae bacterium]|nr:SmdB family multidrug efflux ABC transporter permease/ATP-binding protein [Enterobacteriaceae bacterium]